MKRIRNLVVIGIALATLLASGCTEDSNPLRPTPGADEFSADLAIGWMDLTVDLVRAERWTPPTASRLYGYAGVTLYESVVNGMPNNRSLVGQLSELEELPEFGDDKFDWPTVANAAIATLLRGMFANGSAATLDAITAREEANYAAPTGVEETEIFNRSVNQGKLLGLAIFGWALNDGYPLFNNCTFTPPIGPGKWIPTPPAFAAPLQPCWGNIRPFALTSGSQCMPGPPPTYSETAGSQFHDEMMEVFNTTDTLNEEQSTIAEFWADNPGQTGTPSGHAISVTGQVLAAENKTLGFAAETYAKVGMTVADAFISCWKTKFEYNVLRPVTCIRALIQADWNSLIPTPAFPEYTSGHSVQSSATAHVLGSIFGENYAFTDHTHDGLGFTPRAFASFNDWAEEAAVSRIYGGIHFRSAIEVGLEQGICIGDKIIAIDFEN